MYATCLEYWLDQNKYYKYTMMMRRVVGGSAVLIVRMRDKLVGRLLGDGDM